MSIGMSIREKNIMIRRWYDDLPAQRDIEVVKEYAKWLSRVPWKVYGTFTFALRVSDEHADKVFAAFINCMERELRAPMAFVRGDEKRFSGCGMPGSPRHFHALMTSTAALDPLRLMTVWRRFGGSGEQQDSAMAEAVKNPQKAAEYCLKFINDTDGDWTFHNLDLVLSDDPPVGHRAQRRADPHRQRRAR